jgi:hypothetical protein
VMREQRPGARTHLRPGGSQRGFQIARGMKPTTRESHAAGEAGPSGAARGLRRHPHSRLAATLAVGSSLAPALSYPSHGMLGEQGLIEITGHSHSNRWTRLNLPAFRTNRGNLSWHEGDSVPPAKNRPRPASVRKPVIWARRSSRQHLP